MLNPKAGAGGSQRRPGRVVHEIDDYDLSAFVEEARRFGDGRYGYVVTPNVDHMIRFHESASFRALYAGASYILLDSRIAAILFRTVHGIRAPVCTGSDLTAALFSRVIAPDDRVVLVGGSERQAAALRSGFGLRNLVHHNPPMGFIDDPEAVEACLQFVEAASPFRFCLLAVGSPRQEIVARRLAERGRARGLALCIGASIDFLTGAERRAPVWMRSIGLEWMFRLLQNPRRMAWRYLVRGPKFFAYVGSSAVTLRAAGERAPGGKYPPA
jgi:exopolysaccharide biosynthesis WecB/TagA/CpsF family protein